MAKKKKKQFSTESQDPFEETLSEEELEEYEEEEEQPSEEVTKELLEESLEAQLRELEIIEESLPGNISIWVPKQDNIPSTETLIIEEIKSYFADIPDNSNTAKAANRLYQIGILRGKIQEGAGRILNADETLTVAELALHLEKALDYLLKNLNK